MTQQIIEYFKEGLSNREIAKKLSTTDSTISKQVKTLGLVRTEEQVKYIRQRCKSGRVFEKSKRKYKPESSKTIPDTKNYLIDNIRKGLIDSTPASLEADIEIAVLSIQRLREAKRKKTERNEVVVIETL